MKKEMDSILKTGKLGSSSAPDLWTAVIAQKMPFSRNAVKELEGVPPLIFTANGQDIISYSIRGNMEQNGIPDRSAPIQPDECGDLITSGEHAGEYAIPITSADTTKHIYLSEPLRKIGDYADTVGSDGTVTRRIKKRIFTNNDVFSKGGSGDSAYFVIRLGDSTGTECICSHFVYTSITVSTTAVGASITASSSNLRVRTENVTGTTAEQFNQWISARYSAGTPLTVWYVLATPETETFTAPDIPTVKGRNSLSVGTSLQPQKIYIRYK